MPDQGGSCKVSCGVLRRGLRSLRICKKERGRRGPQRLVERLPRRFQEAVTLSSVARMTRDFLGRGNYIRGSLQPHDVECLLDSIVELSRNARSRTLISPRGCNQLVHAVQELDIRLTPQLSPLADLLGLVSLAQDLKLSIGLPLSRRPGRIGLPLSRRPGGISLSLRRVPRRTCLAFRRPHREEPRDCTAGQGRASRN